MDGTASVTHLREKACAAVLSAVLSSCAPTSSPLPPWQPPQAPAKPAGCAEVAAGGSLQAAIDAAPEGSALCLAAGDHPGPLTLSKPLTLWGPRAAVVRSQGVGTTITLSGHGVALLGFTIDGSGRRYDVTDAAVRVGGEGHRIEGLRIHDAVFGITCELADGVVVRGNEIEGDAATSFGLRGDAIRLWETKNSRVEENHVVDGRDVVVWYSPKNVVAKNRVERSRYGTHFMYSSDNRVEDNLYVGDVVGVFVMYSRGITLERNTMLDAAGAAGIGLGVKESGNLTVRKNRFLHDTTGIYLDTSPLYDDDHNVFEENALAQSGTGVLFHASRARNAFRGNRLEDNQVQVSVEGGGEAQSADWEGNLFDDYAGYDLDGDGVGDVPYALRSISGELTSRYPDLRFLAGMPALSLIDAMGHLVPLYQPQTVLVDAKPRLPGTKENRRAD